MHQTDSYQPTLKNRSRNTCTCVCRTCVEQSDRSRPISSPRPPQLIPVLALSCPALQSLRLDNCQRLSDRGVAALGGSGLASLEVRAIVCQYLPLCFFRARLVACCCFHPYICRPSPEVLRMVHGWLDNRLHIALRILPCAGVLHVFVQRPLGPPPSRGPPLPPHPPLPLVPLHHRSLVRGGAPGQAGAARPPRELSYRLIPRKRGTGGSSEAPISFHHSCNGACALCALLWAPGSMRAA